MLVDNLNELELTVDYGIERHPLRDFSVGGEDDEVQVYFRNLESHLIHHIEAADIIVGCVAWLTSHNILRALSQKIGVSIIVQKEDWLRPDINAHGDWKSELRRLYDRLPSALTRFDQGLRGTALSGMSWQSALESIEAVRCVGNYNSEKTTSPRAHHKFVVFTQVAGYRMNALST
ncbi:MAG: hypothetical protein QOH25_1486 [Acidobacteriota bacterium]|jgi:hypothetical protein|nr:hypothetical protein [Acidobacteriota bacterium]